MLQEPITTDLSGWWETLSFPGKELFRLDASGDIVLLQNSNITERVIANVSGENSGAVLNSLREKYAAAEAKVYELEVEWLATEDKLKLADKITQVKEYLQTVAAVGDLKKLALLVHDWEHTLFAITEENYAVKLKLTELAESLAESTDWKEATQALKDIGDKWKEAGYVNKGRNEKLWARIEAARKVFHDRKRLQHKEEEKDMLLNLDLKIDLVEQAESIAASTDWKTTTDTFIRLTEEWKTIGHTLNKKNEELWHRFIAAKTAFFDKKKEHSDKIQVEQENNYIVKQAIVEKAEALKDSTDWTKTTQAFAALSEEWKNTGRVPKEKGDDLWTMFNAAKDQFFGAKKVHFDALRSVQENNYNLKKEIYDRAEWLKNSTQWGSASAEMNELFEEWKTIGPIPHSYGDDMWKAFTAARKHFFARKDANREQRKQQDEDHKAARIAHDKAQVHKLFAEIKEEEANLADFHISINNITPGKKAAELKSHLEKLIEDTTVKIKRMKEKYDAIMAEDKPKVPVTTVAAPVEATPAAEEPTASMVAEAGNAEEQAPDATN